MLYCSNSLSYHILLDFIRYTVTSFTEINNQSKYKRWSGIVIFIIICSSSLTITSKKEKEVKIWTYKPLWYPYTTVHDDTSEQSNIDIAYDICILHTKWPAGMSEKLNVIERCPSRFEKVVCSMPVPKSMPIPISLISFSHLLRFFPRFAPFFEHWNEFYSEA